MSLVFVSKMAKLETLHEARRAHTYLDSKGHPTVGIGFNLDRFGARSSLRNVGADYEAVREGVIDLTDGQIDALFSSCLSGAIGEARKSVPDLDSLPEVVQLVLVDMTFNMGSVVKFPRMIAAVERRDWEGMIAEMIDSTWYREDVPTRAKHDIELLREQLNVVPHAQELDDTDRAKILAMVAITNDCTIADVLASRQVRSAFA